MGLPGLPEKVIAERLMADITEAERAIAAQPGMYGRIWFGQALAFDEAYQILQELASVSVDGNPHRRLYCIFAVRRVYSVSTWLCPL